MFATLEDFLSTQQRDSNEFMERVRELVIGLARDYEPVRLYVIRIDNWFEPRWMKFAGKFTTGKHFAIGVHKRRLHVPPFVPPRLVVQGVFVGPGYEETVSRPPLHIDCPSSKALVRRIEDIDKDAAFIWFGGDSEAQGRGAVMVYLPVALETTKWRRDLRDCGAFTWATRWGRRIGSLQCCVVFHVVKWRIFWRAVELSAEPTLPNCP